MNKKCKKIPLPPTLNQIHGPQSNSGGQQE